MTDDGIALAAHAGIHEQLVHIAQAHGLLVDIVFRFAAAVVPARDGDLGLLHAGEDVLGVVEHERHLRKAHLVARFRAAENDILHLLAAQRAGILLAHDPANGVRNIRFAASVRPEHRIDKPGPTMAVMSSPKLSTVLSGKLLNPWISNAFKYTSDILLGKRRHPP